MGDRSVNLNQRLPSLDSEDSFGGDLSALAIRQQTSMQQKRRISLQAAAGRQYSQAMIMRTESA
jgi:hypothetical protein